MVESVVENQYSLTDKLRRRFLRVGAQFALMRVFKMRVELIFANLLGTYHIPIGAVFKLAFLQARLRHTHGALQHFSELFPFDFRGLY